MYCLSLWLALIMVPSSCVCCLSSCDFSFPEMLSIQIIWSLSWVPKSLQGISASASARHLRRLPTIQIKFSHLDLLEYTGVLDLKISEVQLMVRSKGKYPLYSSQHSKQVFVLFVGDIFHSTFKKKNKPVDSVLLFWHHLGVFHPAILLEQASGTAFCSWSSFTAGCPLSWKIIDVQVGANAFILLSGFCSTWHLASE